MPDGTEKVTVYIIVTTDKNEHRMLARGEEPYYTTKEAAAKTKAAKLELSKEHDKVNVYAITGPPGYSADEIVKYAVETWNEVRNKKE